ncbi:AraC family transcriptional regulator [Streptomonospora wellingtoniae]|uniref:AraC family transcriptional regulator n=1 Tax=Streptomonospora wellingtoniae TaxID=3075544 RepID=A0ABU2KPG5_9ACTN|nr:AraC family transcriptional regulator [Streptomonospora sp. DSM 45055]MDT0301171.1 AraC family transcriptional regulator [Streptomonospora sp. DSM 45055]
MSDESADRARFWRHPGLPGVELLKAHYVRHTFNRHTHDTYTFALVESGVEVTYYKGGDVSISAGGLLVVEPHEVHTGHAGVPDGWRYRVLYPEVGVVAAVARDLGMDRIPPFIPEEVRDPGSARLVRAAHRATEKGDRLSASTLIRQALHRLLSRHTRAGAAPHAPQPPGSVRAVERARELLHTTLADPPGLEELAAAVDTPPFALLRAFRAAHGLPPHAYVNDVRVQRARRLLADGMPPADVSAALGFADQPHFTRHFKRTTGVPPGAFQRGVRGPAQPG